MEANKITIIPGTGQDQFLKINRSKARAEGFIHVFHIKDGDHIIAFMPALNMTGYGDNQVDADLMLSESLEDYLLTLMKAKPAVMDEELRKYGWSKDWLKRKKYNNNSFIDKNGILKNFEMPEDTPITESVMQVA